VIANAEEITYRDLILEILYLGASRFGLLELGRDAGSIAVELPSYSPVFSQARHVFFK
jgi:D-alanine-D-alanine ligase